MLNRVRKAVKTVVDNGYYFGILGTTFLLQGQAKANTSTGLPWEQSSSTFISSLTGPVALGISTAGIVGSGVGLVVGRDELSDFGRIGLRIALGGSTVVAAGNVANKLFNGSSLFF